MAALALVCLGGAAHAGSNLSVGDVVVPFTRSATAASFNITRVGDLSSTVTVHYQTADGSAIAGVAYTATSGTATLPAGAGSVAVAVPVAAQTSRRSGPARTFTLNLSDAVAVPGPAGQPAFANAAQAVSLPAVYGQAIADFNGDGKPDVVLSGSSQGQLLFLRDDTPDGGAVGSLSPAGTITGLSGPMRVVAADINRDGRPDLIVPIINTNQFVVLINTTPVGAPNFSFSSTTITTPSCGFSTGAAVADINGDGIPDVVLAAPGSSTEAGTNKALVYINTTPQGATVPTLALAASPQCAPDNFSTCQVIAALDVNGDGKPDLAFGNESLEVTVLLNTTPNGAATPTFAPAVAFSVPGGVTGLAVGDFNGDGKPDLASADTGDQEIGATWSVLINTTASGAAVPAFQVISQNGGAPYAVAVADVNGDGRPDVVVSNLNSDGIGNGGIDFYLNQTPKGGAVSFVKTGGIGFADDPKVVGLADFNKDGRLDVTTTDFFTGSTGFFFGIAPTAKPTVTIVDGSATATIGGRRPRR